MSKEVIEDTEVVEKNIDDIQYDNRVGALLLLISYCGLGLFMFYKTAELLVKSI